MGETGSSMIDVIGDVVASTCSCNGVDGDGLAEHGPFAGAAGPGEDARPGRDEGTRGDTGGATSGAVPDP